MVAVTHVGLVGGAGWAGVVMFFVLSGYLITRLLLAEISTSGRVDLAAFYVRRAGRLLPALVAVVIVVTILNLARGYPDAVPIGLAGLFYAASWLQAAGIPTPGLGHTWSLSVEEQFYLVWPLVMIGTIAMGRARLALGVAIAGALALHGMAGRARCRRGALGSATPSAPTRRWTG